MAYKIAWCTSPVVSYFINHVSVCMMITCYSYMMPGRQQVQK